MAFPDLFKLEKLKILAFSDAKRQKPVGDPFEAMFNPQTLSQTVSTVLAPSSGIGSGTQSATFVRVLPSDLTLTLLLDGTGVGAIGLVNLPGRKTVQERIDDLMAIAYRVQGSTHEPSYLKVQWGKFVFECRLASMTVNYTSFERDGSALRAELDLTLIADADLGKQLSLAALTSPDVSHARVVRGGDTLPLLTNEVYGSPAHHLRVARANGLDRIRGLESGLTLIFPPLAR